MRLRPFAAAALLALVASPAVRAEERPAPKAVAAPASAPVAAAAPALAIALEVTGAVSKPRTFDRAALEALPQTDGATSMHGEKFLFRGVRLDALLEAAGFERGEMGPNVPKRDKRSGWKKAVVVTATDGFQAVFSCAELFAGMGPTEAVLALTVDGKPVPESHGPVRLMVRTDGEPSRAVRNVVKVEVVDLRAPVK